jgi:arginine utilization regulatory protein
MFSFRSAPAPLRTASLSQCLRDIEKTYILDSLENNHWNISKAARNLGIIRQSLIYRMKKLSIPPKDKQETCGKSI